MAAITATHAPPPPQQLRPFDMRRDMKAVADLIESCFANTLDADGKRYLHKMRAVAQDKGFNRWASIATSSVSLPLTGFVWEEDGKVVGNLSMIPFFTQGRRIYLIANVAVNPEYRHQGIARALTHAALEKTRQQRVHATWLQVRDDNQVALDLYTKMGFEPRASRTTWNASPEFLRGKGPSGVRVTLRRSHHWTHQRTWLDQNYPHTLRWHLPLKTMLLQPGLWGMFYRFFNEIYIQHWAVQRGNQLLGVLTWQGSYSYADRLWLAAPPESEDVTLEAVLPYIHRERRLRRPLSLDYPAGRAIEALSAAGFEPQRTLIWMEAKP